MPCNCDHLEPTGEERRLSKIACLLDELETGNKKIDKSHWRGMHPNVYSQTYDKYNIPQEGMERELVSRLTDLSPKQLQQQSLEMQIWWRDYQRGEKERLKESLENKKKEQIKAKALEKLTSEEREILGINGRNL